MAGPYTIREVTDGSSDPSPSEWANQDVKPAIEDLHLRVAVTEAFGLFAMTPRVAGDYISAISNVAGSTGVESYSGTGNIYGCPILLGQACPIDGMSISMITADSGEPIRLLLYQSDLYGHPTTLVATGTGTSPAGGADLTFSFSSVTIPAGLYWAFVRTDDSSTIRFRGWQGTQVMAAFSGIATSFQTQRNPLPLINPGLYASPISPITTWAYGAPTTVSVPNIGVRRG